LLLSLDEDDDELDDREEPLLEPLELLELDRLLRPLPEAGAEPFCPASPPRPRRPPPEPLDRERERRFRSPSPEGLADEEPPFEASELLGLVFLLSGEESDEDEEDDEEEEEEDDDDDLPPRAGMARLTLRVCET
jgi:hypothetical protein